MHHLHLLLYVPTISLSYLSLWSVAGLFPPANESGIALIVWVALLSGRRILGRCSAAGNISGLCAFARARPDRSLKCVDVVFKPMLERRYAPPGNIWESMHYAFRSMPDHAPLSHRPLSESPDRQAADTAHAAQLVVRPLAAITAAYRSNLPLSRMTMRAGPELGRLHVSGHARHWPCLPSTVTESAPPLAPDSKTNLTTRWIVIPRVGVTEIPF